MNQETIKIILGEFWDRPLPDIIPRSTELPEIKGKIQTAIGMRRVGKTYFLFQQIQKLLKEKIHPQQILFLNIEDDRILPLNAKKLGEIVDAFYSLYPENHNKKCYLFFDEIQNAEDWPLVIRRLQDSKNADIYLSGSSSKLLSTEISTRLRGRSLATTIWPFSFTEYLRAANVHFKKHITGSKEKDFFKKELETYLLTGGFPEVVQLTPHERIRILNDYINVVIQRDIIERHQVRDVILLKQFIKFLISSSAQKFSINKCFNDFKSQGLRLSKNTLHDYLDHIQDCFLCFPVPLMTQSVRKQNSNPRKIYAVDTGLVSLNLFFKPDNLGPLFENLIYLDLRRKGYNVFYYNTKSNYEIDFCIHDKQGKLKIYQVCWDISDKNTLLREKRALEEAQQELNVEGLLLTPENYWEFLKEL